MSLTGIETIVDCDVHPGIHLDKIVEYVDAGHRPDIKRLSQQTATRGASADLYDRDLDTDPTAIDTPDDIRTYVCDELHVDYPILTPLNSLLEVRNPRKDLSAPMMRAQNDWLLDYYIDQDDRFYLCAQLSTREPDEAAAEIDRIGNEKRVVGVLFYNTSAAPLLGDPVYDEVYRAAEDNGLQIAFHGGTSQLQFGFPRLSEHLSTWFEAGICAHLLAQQATLISLMKHGTFEKFPNLNFIFLESGISWALFMMFRLNGVYWKRKREAPLLEQSPEEYIRQRCYFGTQPLEEPIDSTHLKQALEIVGTDRILFTSDYPHWDADHTDILRSYSLNFDNETKNKIMGGTARELFELPAV